MKSSDKNYMIKNTNLNFLHNQIRNANALGLIDYRNKKYNEYKRKGGKRTLANLLLRKPIRK
jgi:hypothetical protein